MLNLYTDYYKVTIGSYFSALCGDYSALKKIKFLPVSGTANRLACAKITDSIGRKDEIEHSEDVISEFIRLNQEIELIYLFMKVFDYKGSLPDNLAEIAKNKGLFTDEMFDPFKADNRVKQLSVKRKIALADLSNQHKPSANSNEPLTKISLANQIATINHAGNGGRGGISLNSSVAEYFSELTYLDNLAKRQKQNG